MLIEYKIKFEKDGLTIAQHIEPNSVPVIHTGANKVPVSGLPATQQEAKTLAATNPLTKIDVGGSGGPTDVGGSGGPTDVGGSGAGTAPIFILGPIVFGGSVPYERRESTEPTKPEAQPKVLGTAAGKGA